MFVCSISKLIFRFIVYNTSNVPLMQILLRSNCKHDSNSNSWIIAVALQDIKGIRAHESNKETLSFVWKANFYHWTKFARTASVHENTQTCTCAWTHAYIHIYTHFYFLVLILGKFKILSEFKKRWGK